MDKAPKNMYKLFLYYPVHVESGPDASASLTFWTLTLI